MYQYVWRVSEQSQPAKTATVMDAEYTWILRQGFKISSICVASILIGQLVHPVWGEEIG